MVARGEGSQDVVESLVATSRLLVAVVARSLAEADATVSTTQLRVLVLLASHGEVNLAAVARGLGVNPSNASRTCEQLVLADLVSRREDPVDRRQVVLGLTERGAALVQGSMDHRRATFSTLVQAMSPEARSQLAAGLEELLGTAAQLSDPPLAARPGASGDGPGGGGAGEDARPVGGGPEVDRLLRWLL